MVRKLPTQVLEILAQLLACLAGGSDVLVRKTGVVICLGSGMVGEPRVPVAIANDLLGEIYGQDTVTGSDLL